MCIKGNAFSSSSCRAMPPAIHKGARHPARIAAAAGGNGSRFYKGRVIRMTGAGNGLRIVAGAGVGVIDNGL